jgi:Na+/melibiose symporter-like transporter
MFHNRIVCGAALTQFTNGWLTYVQMFYIPQFYQLAYGYSPIKAGALLLPLLCVQSLSSTLSGLIVSRTGRYREILLSGWILWSVGLGLFSTLTPSSGLGKQIGFSLITGFGVGQTLQVALVALQGAVPRKDMAVVTAMRNFARNLGAALGIAIASTIVNTLTVHELTPQGWSTAQVRSALDNPSALFSPSSSSSTSSASLSAEQLNELRQAYSEGFRVVFLVLAGLAAASFFVTVALMRQRTLTREDDAALKEEGKRTVRLDRESKRARKEAAAVGGRGRGGGGGGAKEERGAVAVSAAVPVSQHAVPQPAENAEGGH